MIYDFKTRYTSKPFKGEKNNGEFKIDPTGYIPAKRQIENMLYAGAQLDQSRLEDYDFRPGDKLEYREAFDMRAPDLDASDVTRIMQHTYSGVVPGEAVTRSDNPDSSGSGDSNPGAGTDGSDGKSVEE